MSFIGIDPDLRVLSWAQVGEDGRLVAVGVDHIKDKGKGLELAMKAIRRIDYSMPGLLGVERVLIEAQNVRYTGKTNSARPQDLVHLALVAGAWAQACSNSTTYVDLILPTDWKGSIAKHIHQNRIWSHLNIPYEVKGGQSPYPVPTLPDYVQVYGKPRQSDWADITDSVGLAVYAREMWKREQRRQERAARGGRQ